MASRYGASRAYSLDTTQFVALLWMSDKPDSETSPWQHTTLTTNKHSFPLPPWESNPRSQKANCRLRLYGHWDRQTTKWQKKGNQEPPGNLRNWTGTILSFVVSQFSSVPSPHPTNNSFCSVFISLVCTLFLCIVVHSTRICGTDHTNTHTHTQTHTHKQKFRLWRCQVRVSSYNSNKLTNQMQQFHKYIAWHLCVAQHVSGASTPIISSLQLQ